MPSLQFLELSDLVYSPCNYIVKTQEILEFPPSSSQCRVPLESTVSLSFRLLSVPHASAALVNSGEPSEVQCGQSREVAKSVRACAIGRALYLSGAVQRFPETAARVRALSEADPEPIGSIPGPSLTKLGPHTRTPARHTATLHTPYELVAGTGRRVGFVLGDCSPQTSFPAHQRGVM